MNKNNRRIYGKGIQVKNTKQKAEWNCEQEFMMQNLS